MRVVETARENARAWLEVTRMKRLMIPVSIMLAFLANPASADEIEFRPAYHLTAWSKPLTAGPGEAAIRFRDFLKIDWEQLAKAHYTAYPLTGLSETQIAELAKKMSLFGDANIDYPAPVTEEYSRARFVFLSADGSRPLNVTGLKGIVRYALTRDLKRVTRVSHFGGILGMPDPNNAPGGGFVALLKDGQEFLSETIVGPENPALDAVNPLKGLGVLTQIEYRFSGADAAYLFVQYEADNDCIQACCQFSYYLFRKDPETGELTQLRYSRYACDI